MVKSITVDYDDVTPQTVGHRLTDSEAVLHLGSRRLPVALTDRAGLMEALQVADAMSAAVLSWRGDLVAALQKLDAAEYARENATT
ncbi:hypothetical protein [Microbispora bryophytorum]|uniref:hypothetical protein n=1 Tax=Microbispora bryophytorum TaxID=1460882 RepID=UPI0033F68DE5